MLVASLSDLGFSEEGAIIKSIESDDCGRGQKQWKAEAIHHYFFKFKIKFFLCVWLCCLHLRLCTTCVSAHGGKKRVSDSLGLEL